MGDANDLSEIEQQLLMAAAVHRLGPQTDLRRANTVRIVDQVLAWRGLSAEQRRAGWWDDGDSAPSHKAVYGVLIRMTEPVNNQGSWRAAKRPGLPLFEGGGNWGVPGNPNKPACWPHYNSCRLTNEGEQLARLLLDGHPEYRLKP
jgi:hypothetical protein